MTPRRIALIGAGFSGAATAWHLLRRAAEAPSAQGTLEVMLIEREPRQFARGVAYSTFDPRHILNVPAARMGLDPAAPADFLDWTRARGFAPATDAGEWFAPRQLYGQYLEQRLKDAEASAGGRARLRRISAEAIDARREGGGWTVVLRDGDALAADALVLALGNFPPPHPVVADPQGYDSPRWFNRAWEPGAVEGLGADDAVLLIGTGLSSLDMLVSLVRNGHRGPIHALSRRGLWPLPHGPAPAWPDPLPDPLPDAEPPRIAALVRQVRAAIAAAAAAGVPWISVINALRPRTSALWGALPLAERRRFLRHVRPWWEVARHRMPRESAALVEALTASGQLVTHRGRMRSIVESARGLAIGIARRGAKPLALEVQRAINCTGAESNYRKLGDPLVRGLMRHGLLHADALHLGLATNADGRIEDAHGVPVPGLWTLGPCRKGSLWETTAVPEIRVQAAALAAKLLER